MIPSNSPSAAHGDRPPEPPAGDRCVVQITDLTSDGRGVGRYEGRVVFVPGAVPGDRVRARITRRARRHLEARIESIETPSADRVPPDCPHQGPCGGCPLMVLRPERAFDLKVRRLVEQLRRLGHLEPPVPRRIAAPATRHTRNRVRFAVAGETSVGFRAPGSRAVVEVGTCLLGPPDAAEIARALLASGRSARARRTPAEISVRSVDDHERHLAVLHFDRPFDAAWRAAARRVVSQRRDVAGVVATIARSVRGRGATTLAGTGRVATRVPGPRGDIELEVGATSFSQVDDAVAGAMYAAIRAAARAAGPPRSWLDLYCGHGLAGLVAADPGERLVGLDAHAGAIAAARRAARAAGHRARYQVGDAAAGLDAFARAEEGFDAVLVNPPRRGAGEGVMARVAGLAREVVVVVSCNPAALARDLGALIERGWVWADLVGVDLFPNTAHIEAFAVLRRRAIA